MPQSTSTATLAVFAPGTHTAMDGRSVMFTLDDCIDLASSYDPELSEAPFVIGHPKLTAPAYGWAARFEVRDGLVYTEPKQVNADFAEAFNAGSFKKRSLSLYLPDSPGNPKPGHYYPRHVGFLGAVPPAIKGLPDVSFAEADAPLEFAIPWETELLTDMFRGLRDYLVEKEGAEKADQILPQWRIKSVEELAARAAEDAQISPLAYAEESNVSKIDPSASSAAVDLAARQADLDAREERIKLKEKQDQEAAAAKRRTDITSFADGLVTAGQLLPRQKNTVVELLVSLANEPISFADGSTTVSKTPEELLRSVLSEKPKLLDFSEKSGQEAEGDALDFADVNAVADKAREYQEAEAQKGRTISMTAAVNHVKGGNK
ncbi:peptidase [Serratia fonticola]|nr:peptidase [Serratia fonticola]